MTGHSGGRRINLAVVVTAFGLTCAATWLHFFRPSLGSSRPTGASADSTPTPATLSPALTVPAASPEPAIKHPIHAVEGPAGLPDAESLSAGLMSLFGRRAVISLFQLGDFPQRVVATVDNLGRHFAPTAVWPLNPAPGHFSVERLQNTEAISVRNAQRYARYLQLLETVDTHQAIAFYVRFYPLFQAAYEGIGFPKRNFNDRLVEVLDQLLATPDLSSPASVSLPSVNGPDQPTRPWVLYRFNDPALESLSAGQKIVLRFGPSQEQRLKARLSEYRRLIIAEGEVK